MLDLPHPFGPTTPVKPLSIITSVGSTKDLNHTLVELLDRTTYNWSVIAGDDFENQTASETWNFIIDISNPIVTFSEGTEESGKHFNRNWIFMNVTVDEPDEANITFYLYNSTFDLIKNTI